MKAIAVVLGMGIFLYIGYAIGLTTYCGQVHGLSKAKKYAWTIPLYLIMYPFFLLFLFNKEEKWQALHRFLKLPYKGTVFAIIYEEILTREEGKAYNNQREPEVLSWACVSRSIFSKASSIRP